MEHPPFKVEKKIAVVGLGYVGLPLAVEFAKQYATTGYDINTSRIKELKSGHDRTCEVDTDTLNTSSLIFTHILEDIQNCNIYIVTVPTPIDKYNRPDLSPLLSASRSIGTIMKKSDII